MKKIFYCAGMIVFMLFLGIPAFAQCEGIKQDRDYVAPRPNPCSGSRLMSYYSKVKFGVLMALGGKNASD